MIQRSLLCRRQGCMAKAVYKAVKLLLYADPVVFPGAPPAVMMVDMPSCEEHSKEIKPEIFFGTLEQRRLLEDAFRKAAKVVPDLDCTKLELVPIEED